MWALFRRKYLKYMSLTWGYPGNAFTPLWLHPMTPTHPFTIYHSHDFFYSGPSEDSKLHFNIMNMGILLKCLNTSRHHFTLWPHVMTPTCPFTYQPKPLTWFPFPAGTVKLHFNMGIKPVDTIHPVTPPHDPTPSTSLYKATHMVSFQMDLAANIVFCISTWRCHCTPSTPVYTLSPLWPHPHDPNLSICLSVEHKGTHILCLWFEINGMRTLTLLAEFQTLPPSAMWWHEY